MNLRHIDEFLERHAAGWNPFKGDFRISKGSFKNNPLEDLFGKNSMIGHGYLGIADLGKASAGAVGYQTPEAKGDKKAEEESARSAAAAAIKQAEFEASKREGLERLALKRKKGFGASMLVNPTLGSSATLGG